MYLYLILTLFNERKLQHIKSVFGTHTSINLPYFSKRKSRVWSVSNVFANAIFTRTLDLINWWDVQIAAFPLRAPIRRISYVCISEIRYSFIYKFGHLIYIRRSKELRKTIPLAQRFAYAKRLILFIWKERRKGAWKNRGKSPVARHARKLILLLKSEKLCLFSSSCFPVHILFFDIRKNASFAIMQSFF